MTTKARPLSKSSDPKRRNQLTVIGIIVAVAIIAAVAVILLSNRQPAVDLGQYQNIPQSRLPDGGFVIGNPNARVTLVEFADYACPVCQAYLPTMDQFFNDYVKTGEAKFEYRIFPTHGREMTQFNGEIAVCLEEQKPGAFWQAKDLFIQEAPGGTYNNNAARNVA